MTSTLVDPLLYSNSKHTFLAQKTSYLPLKSGNKGTNSRPERSANLNTTATAAALLALCLAALAARVAVLAPLAAAQLGGPLVVVPVAAAAAAAASPAAAGLALVGAGVGSAGAAGTANAAVAAEDGGARAAPAALGLDAVGVVAAAAQATTLLAGWAAVVVEGLAGYWEKLVGRSVGLGKGDVPWWLGQVSERAARNGAAGASIEAAGR